MVGHHLRIWREAKGVARQVAGPPADPPSLDGADGPIRDGTSWLAQLPTFHDYWVEIDGVDGAEAPHIVPLVSQLLDRDRDALAVARELADRYEEIELLYTISETLGRTIGLTDAARTIVREVGRVVGAERASILVHDAGADLLRPVAGWGIDVEAFEPIPGNDPQSVAARAFRERRPIVFDPATGGTPPSWDEPRTYRGRAFLSVPITYPAPDQIRPVGVINLTDRIGTDTFTDAEVRLVVAIATQIGAAIENARLVERDRRQQRLRRELELARDLQLKLLKPHFAAGAAVAARCLPAESVGGDFYHLVRLGDQRLGVMLGDVSSHGFSAALMMALVLSAAGIHAEDAATPDEALRRLFESVGDELREAEMYLTVFYGVPDPEHGVLRYANAGHPYAFRFDASGEATRLGATSPPLGLVEGDALAAAEAPWCAGSDLLVVFSDGLTDARDADGKAFGEARVLDIVRAHRTEGPEHIVDAVFSESDRFSASPRDDRTMLVLGA